LGGLIARALVGQLHARSPSFFDKHRPAAFATIATPHLGVLKYGSWQSQWVHALGQRLFSRTGQQLYCLDGTLSGSPLLATMAHPGKWRRDVGELPSGGVAQSHRLTLCFMFPFRTRLSSPLIFPNSHIVSGTFPPPLHILTIPHRRGYDLYA
jgi:hypothetical protein